MKASAYFTVTDLGGKHATGALKQALDTLGGVNSVSVSRESGTIAVDYDTTGESREKIEETIKKLGYDVLDVRLDKRIE